MGGVWGKSGRLERERRAAQEWAKGKKLCGRYYLWDGAAVLYVGASRDVEKTVRKHARDGIDFCGYFFDECEASEFAEREAAARKEFRPPFKGRIGYYWG